MKVVENRAHVTWYEERRGKQKEEEENMKRIQKPGSVEKDETDRDRRDKKEKQNTKGEEKE